jgi:serine/threonine protein kinase
MYNKWLIIDILEKKGNTTIYNVKPNINDDTSEIIKNNLKGKKWVLKLINNNHSKPYIEEIQNTEDYQLYKSSYCVNMPEDSSFRSGIIDNKCWYVMEKYDDSLKNNFLFGKNKMGLLISNIIDSLEWIHLTHNIVHGDIKIDNILINFNNTEKPFCLIDYESMTKPNSLNCIKNLPNGYYYFGLGCISDKPFMSYRMDLQAFGYLLWCLSLSIDSYHRFNWQMKAFTYYDNNKITSEFYDLENIQNIENLNANMNDLIKSYFEIISEVDWFEKESPNPDIYKRIKNLITSLN